MKTAPASSVRLLKSAPAGLTIQPSRQWTAADRRIWHEFDDLIEDATLFGGGPMPHKTCMGRFNGQTVLFWRAIGDSHGPASFESGFGACRGSFDRWLVVSTWVYGYSEDGTCKYDSPLFANANLLKGDGTYDVFKDKIPKDLLQYVSGDMFPRHWREYFAPHDSTSALEDFVKNEVGSIEEIKDPAVKTHLKKLLKPKKFIILGSFKVMGSVQSSECKLAFRKEDQDKFTFKVIPKIGDEIEFGPSSLGAVFLELVETYDLEEGEELLKMFQASNQKDLLTFDIEQ